MNIAPHIEHTRLNAAITEKDIDGLIREAVEYNFPAGIKASGGIKTYEQAVALINPGADRIGTSTGVGITMQSIYKS